MALISQCLTYPEPGFWPKLLIAAGEAANKNLSVQLLLWLPARLAAIDCENPPELTWKRFFLSFFVVSACRSTRPAQREEEPTAGPYMYNTCTVQG